MVLPCLNEELTVPGCIAEARGGIEALGHDPEILVVDNGSTDRTAQVAEAAGARVVRELRPGYGSALDRCHCSPSVVRRYRSRLSGPLRDRLDLWVEMDREPAGSLWNGRARDGLARRVLRARAIRQADGSALLREKDGTAVDLDPEAQTLAAALADRTASSLRALHAAVRVARTISALDGREKVKAPASFMLTRSQ